MQMERRSLPPFPTVPPTFVAVLDFYIWLRNAHVCSIASNFAPKPEVPSAAYSFSKILCPWFLPSFVLSSLHLLS